LSIYCAAFVGFGGISAVAAWRWSTAGFEG
jgi:hypothetical protein